MFILMETHSLDFGEMMFFMVMEYICTAMVRFIKGISIMVIWKVKEYITMKNVLLTIMEVGTKEKNMGKEHTSVKRKFIKENGNKEKDMEEGITKIN